METEPGSPVDVGALIGMGGWDWRCYHRLLDAEAASNPRQIDRSGLDVVGLHGQFIAFTRVWFGTKYIKTELCSENAQCCGCKCYVGITIVSRRSITSFRAAPRIENVSF